VIIEVEKEERPEGEKRALEGDHMSTLRSEQTSLR